MCATLQPRVTRVGFNNKSSWFSADNINHESLQLLKQLKCIYCNINENFPKN